MGDFPQEVKQVELSDLIHRAVDRSYEDLYALSRKLPSETDEQRREMLLKYLQDARQRLIQLLVLVKWSVQVPLIEQCANLEEKATSLKNQLNETNDRLFFMHADLNRAKETAYDISTAVDVLYGGSYLRLPTIIENAMMPRPLPDVDVDSTVAELDEVLRFRMLETVIPPQFTRVEVLDGLLICEAAGEFELVLTLQGKEADSKWLVVKIETLVNTTDNPSRVLKSAAPTSNHYKHLRNLVQRKLNVSAAPLVDAFTIIRDFCSCLALEVLYAQANDMIQGRWKHKIQAIYDREQHVLVLSYWSGQLDILTSHASGSSTESLQLKVGSAAIPKDSFCVRISIDTEGCDLLKPALHPSVPQEITRRSLMKNFVIPSNLQELSAEKILLSAMRAHRAYALYSFAQLMTLTVSPPMLSLDTSDGPVFSTGKLITGESIAYRCTNSTLYMRRMDIPELVGCIEISVDLRRGKFLVDAAGSLPRGPAADALKELQRILQLPTQLLISSRQTSSVDTSNSLRDAVVQTALQAALREIFAEEIDHTGRSCLGIIPERDMPLAWEKFVNYRVQHGGDAKEICISKGSLFFRLASGDGSYYLVIEIDRNASVDDLDNGQDESDLLRMPCCALLQASGGKSELPGVQFLQRLPAFRLSALLPQNELRRKKCKTDTEEETKTASTDVSYCARGKNTVLRAFLLAAIDLAREKFHLQTLLSDLRRLKVKCKYFGEGGTTSGEVTGGQVLTLSFPESFNVLPIKVKSLTAHLQPGGGLEMCLCPEDFPFTILPGDPKIDNRPSHTNHRVLPEGQLLFRYPSAAGFWLGHPAVGESIESFIKDLVYEVRPLTKFLAKLEKIAKEFGRYGSPASADGQFYLEKADPFGAVLACRCKNSRVSIAAGGTVTGEITYRVYVHIRKHTFVLSFSHELTHPLISYIQSALNTHHCPLELLEILERTTIPMSIVSGLMESKLLSAKYHRQDQLAAEGKALAAVAEKASSSNGKKGGKGMKLGYKGKFGGKGMRLGYTSDKLLGSDEKQFTPSDLVLIPRSQNRIKLAYSNRCSVDIWFLANKMIRVKSANDGVTVPSCSGADGQMITHSNFAEKLNAICTEMGKL